MKKIKHLLTFIVLFLSFTVQDGHAESVKEYKRIVSLMPSATEILFAIGAGDRVVGVTRYCRFPPEVQNLPQVGGIMDTNYEMVFQLQPDLVVLTNDGEEQQQKMDAMGFETLAIETKNIPGIMDSIRRVGAKVGKEREAEKVANAIQNKMDEVREKTKDLPKPKVMITYLRPLGEGSIREVYIAGNKTYFDKIIEAAGGVNAFQGVELVVSPIVTPEGILEMNPDVIIELIGSLDQTPYAVDEVKKDWDMLPELNAYQNGRIHIFSKPYVSLPGPRLVKVIEDIARVIHPEVDWN